MNAGRLLVVTRTASTIELESMTKNKMVTEQKEL
jgi:hypothetical protein